MMGAVHDDLIGKATFPGLIPGLETSITVWSAVTPGGEPVAFVRIEMFGMVQICLLTWDMASKLAGWLQEAVDQDIKPGPIEVRELPPQEL